MTYSHIAYVDEAGDEGFGKLRNPDRGGQSQWLLLGAAIVRAHSDPLLPKWRDEILGRFSASKIKDLHFRNLKHDQKVVGVKVTGPRTLVHIASDAAAN